MGEWGGDQAGGGCWPLVGKVGFVVAVTFCACCIQIDDCK